MLANDFGRLFTQKIDDIPLKLDSIDPHQISLTTRPGVASKSTRILAHPLLTSSLYRLKVSVKKLVLNAANKTCDNDPIPFKIVKDCINELLPTISNLVNLSLSSGHFPDI